MFHINSLSRVVLIVTIIATEMTTLVFHKTEKYLHCKNPFSTVASVFYPYYKAPLECTGSTASHLDTPLIPSLFPEVLPPSIKFVFATTSENLARRRSLFSHLNWIELPEPPPVVAMVISASGLSFVPFGSTNDWTGFVNAGENKRDEKRRPENVIKSPTCKFNQMPNGTTLDHKVEFQRHYRRYQKRFPTTWDWHLPAFILPDEVKMFRSTFRQNPSSEAWIYKPSTTANSAGIEVLRSGNFSFKRKKAAVVQKFLPDPFILEDARVEPRFYIVITSIHPLRIYAFNNSFTKMVLDYELNTWRVGFTKTRVNKRYLSDQTFKHFWPRMAKAGFDVQKLKAEMMDIVIKAIFMGGKEIYEASKKFPRKTSYQTYNVDFMWRMRDMKPYLIELNRFPTFKDGYHYKHYRHHLADMLTLVGYQVNIGVQNEAIAPPCDCEEVLLKTNLGVELNQEDKLDLMEAEDELNRMKGTEFSRLFPSRDMFQYLQYVESDIKPYLVQFAWEEAFGENRKEGVCYLRCLSNLEESR